MLDYKFFCIHASKVTVITINQLKFIYKSSFIKFHSHPIDTCFPMIASNVTNWVSQWKERKIIIYMNKSVPFDINQY